MRPRARHADAGVTGPAIGDHGRRRRYRRHELALPDGGTLRLGVDGTIVRLEADGSTTRSWAVADPDWPNQAIRFGLRPEAPTVTPHGQRFADPRLPGA
jgi:hypothetical protein